MMRSHGWDRDLPEKAQKEIRESYGCSDFEGLYNFYLPGMNVRSTDLQAFIGLRAIDKLDDYSSKRRENFKYYIDNLKSNVLSLKEKENDYVSSFAIPIVNEMREYIVRDLMDNDIEVRPLIAGNMANKPMWKGSKEGLENCELLDKFGFYVPNHQDLTKEEIDKIVDIINKYV